MDTILALKCFKHSFIQEPQLKIRPDLEHGRFEVIDDLSNAVSSAMIGKITATIARHPGITQQDLIEKAGLPESNGRKAVQQGEGIHWFSKRGKGNTLHYYLKN
jgi:hypothetical protein